MIYHDHLFIYLFIHSGRSWRRKRKKKKRMMMNNKKKPTKNICDGNELLKRNLKLFSFFHIFSIFHSFIPSFFHSIPFPPSFSFSLSLSLSLSLSPCFHHEYLLQRTVLSFWLFVHDKSLTNINQAFHFYVFLSLFIIFSFFLLFFLFFFLCPQIGMRVCMIECVSVCACVCR